MTPKIAINGFGRIGRSLYRIIHEKEDVEVVAIKDRMPIENEAYLLKYDSNYGEFEGKVEVKENNLIIDEKKIPYFQEKDINKIPWDDFGVNILVDSSGTEFSDNINLVIKGNLTNIIYAKNLDEANITIVYGVNNEDYDPNKHKIISASSCTGNAVVPIVKIIDDEFGIKYGHFVNIHPEISNHNVVDSPYKYYPLGRSSLSSIIPSKSGIANSLTKIIPSLEGKVTAEKFNVPTEVVSAVNMHLVFNSSLIDTDLLSLLQYHEDRDLAGIIKVDTGFMGTPKFSIDFLKEPYSVIVSGPSTEVNGKQASLTLFHDNEWGFSSRVYDLLNYIHKRNLQNAK